MHQARHFAALFIALALLVLPRGEAAGHGYEHKGLEIVHPWCFATKDKAETVAIYMVIRNRTKRADRLLGGTTADGRKIELRAPAADTGRTAAGLPLPAGKETVLKRGAHYLAIVGEGDGPLDPFGSFLATLTFQHAGKIEVEVMIEETPNAPSH
jgi:copper(I)-binding protein